MLKNLKPGNRYIIVNIDEPYAEEIYEILKKGQEDKEDWPEGDISFKEWLEETFGVEDFWVCGECGNHIPLSRNVCPCEYEED